MLIENEWNTINCILLDLYTINDISILSSKLMKMFRMLIPYKSGYFILLDDNKSINAEQSYFMGMPEDTVKKYLDIYYNNDYLRYMYEMTTDTTVYRDSDILIEDIRKQTPFYNEFLRPLDIPFGCGILLMKNGSVIGIFNLFRGEDFGDFNDKDIYILNIFKKHIENITYNLMQQDRKNSITDKCFENAIHTFNLTHRESEILHLISIGKSNVEIGDELYISISTVKKHIYNLYSKIGVKSRTQMLNLLYNQ